MAKLAPMCGKCKTFMRCEKNGQAVLVEDELYMADLYACASCDVLVLAGFGAEPVRVEVVSARWPERVTR